MQRRVAASVGILVPWLARAALGAILLGVSACVTTGRLLRGRPPSRRPRRSARTVLALAGFDNPNWGRAHLLPIRAATGVSRLVLISHRQTVALRGIVASRPPRWLSRLLTPGAAKLVWAALGLIRYRPDVLVGYHIMPNGLACLALAALCGAQAVYQMTGGPVQLAGGGYRSEAAILRSLGRPAPLFARWLLWLVRQFDAIVVRGPAARSFLRANGVTAPIAVITAGIDTSRFSPNGARPRYDLVTVARLVPVKRLDRLLELASLLARRRPATQIAIVGDGPLRAELESRARRLGLGPNVCFLGAVNDVPTILRQSRLFVLTSESEGLSIAMLEAMAVGVPPVVPPVGELASFVEDGQTGLLIDPSVPASAAERVLRVLEDPQRTRLLAAAARRCVAQRASQSAAAAAWSRLLEALDARAGARQGDTE